MRPILPLVLLLAPATLLFPAASATTCDDAYRTMGPREWQEVVGVDSQNVSIYTRQWTYHTECDGDQSWLENCTGATGSTSMGPIGTPEVRVLGLVVVPKTDVVPALLVPWGWPSTSYSHVDGCLVFPVHVGVHNGFLITVDDGTDNYYWP